MTGKNIRQTGGPKVSLKDGVQIIYTYLSWLGKEKKVKLNPDQLIADNLQCIHGSKPTDVETKRKHTDWLNEYVNVVLIKAGLGDDRRKQLANSATQFYTLNDSKLFGHFKVADHFTNPPAKALVADEIRKVLAALPIGQRAPLLLIWQSGMEVSKVLTLKWGQLDLGTHPVKLEFHGRKNHKKDYFSFLGRDSVDNLKVWREKETKLLGREPTPEDLVFLSKRRDGQPRRMTNGSLNAQLHRTAQGMFRQGLVKNGDNRSWTTHKLRHSFETEASHAGVKAEFRDFFMGHITGIQWVYNHRDEVHPEDLVQEYAKIEPYVSLNPTENVLRKSITDSVTLQQSSDIEVLRKQVQFLTERINSSNNFHQKWLDLPQDAAKREADDNYEAIKEAVIAEDAEQRSRMTLSDKRSEELRLKMLMARAKRRKSE